MILYEKAVLTQFCRPYNTSPHGLPVCSGVVLRHYTIGLVDAVSLLRARMHLHTFYVNVHVTSLT